MDSIRKVALGWFFLGLGIGLAVALVVGSQFHRTTPVEGKTKVLVVSTVCALTRTADDVAVWDGTSTHDYLRYCSKAERRLAAASQEKGGPNDG